MAGETNLNTLLRTMKPELNEGEYVFCTLPPHSSIETPEILGHFREKEGLTVVVSKAHAQKSGWKYTTENAWITLTVHSSLEAVGLTAAFSKALSSEGISCNVIAAFYHDHIFVGKKDAGKAMKILQGLSGTAE